MVRISLVALVVAAAVSNPAHADPHTPVLTIAHKDASMKPAPAVLEASVRRSRGHGIKVTLHGGGGLCMATWTLRDAVLHAESNADAPATASCTIVLAVAPWPSGHHEVGVQIDDAKVQQLHIR